MSKQSIPRILVVDDQPANIEIVAEIFEDTFEVLFATDGEKALDLASTGRPDLILLDVMMPGLDGYEVCRRLKDNPATHAIPVIFVTAMNDEANETKGFELGAVDYIAKPFLPAVVRARVQTHLELARARKTIEQTSVQRREMLHVLCHDLANPLGGIAGLLEVIETFEDYQTYKPHLVSSAQNGLDIIDMVRSMQALETGKFRIGPVNLAASIVQSRNMLHSKLAAKEICLDVNAPDDIAVMAESTSLVNSVLNNLLTNAIKFSHPGGTIRLETADRDGQVTLSVRDYGVGMPPDLCAALFDLKKNTSRTGTAGEIGTGFGMPLVQRFMNAYGGDIRVLSNELSAAPDNPGTEILLSFNCALGTERKIIIHGVTERLP